MRVPHQTPHRAQQTSLAYQAVAVAGPTCAGKTTTAHYLQVQFGFEFIEASDAVLTLWEIHRSSTETIREFAERAYIEFGPLWFLEYVLRNQYTRFSRSFCYCGLRKEEEFELLTRLYPQVRLIYIDAPVAERYRRLTLRNRSSDQSMNESIFMLEEQRQVRLGLLRLRDRASFLVTNDGSIEELHERVNAIVAALPNSPCPPNDHQLERQVHTEDDPNVR